MTENAPDSEAPSLAIGLSVVAIGLIVLGSIGGIVACPDRKCVTDHLQHALAILGTVTAALASGVQGKTAKMKSDHHQELSAKEKDATLKSAHTYDASHFKTVSVWWYTFFGGAVAAVLAELIDWWGKPFIDSLYK